VRRISDMKNLPTKRNAGLVILLTFVTFGIYYLVLLNSFAEETNTSCQEDKKKTTGVLLWIVFTIFTFGIYSLVWNWKIVSRRYDYLKAHGVNPGVSPLVHFLFSFILIETVILPIVALVQFMHYTSLLTNKTM
jgi:hypothetical protein